MTLTSLFVGPGQERLARRLLVAAAVIGLALDVWLGSRMALMGLETSRSVARVAAIEGDRTALEPQIASLRALEQRRDLLRRRQESLHAIGASRQLWSTKLARLAELYADRPLDWVDKIELTRTSVGGPALTIDFLRRGTDLRDAARLRELLLNDAVFFTGFDRFDVLRTNVRDRSHTPDEEAPLTYFAGTFRRGS